MSRIFKLDYIPDPNRGRPLFDAKIFIGQPNTDPTVPANQITLTGDIGFPLGGVITLTQPVRTNNGGVTVYNNSPVDINTPGQSYSIQVFDRLNNLIYNFPNVDGQIALNTTAQEELTGLTIFPEVDNAENGQTIASGSDALRAAFNSRNTLFTISPSVVTTGVISGLTINPDGTGSFSVDTDDYTLKQYNTPIVANDGDSQLAGGAIWPVSSQKSAVNGDILSFGERYIRVDSQLYQMEPAPSTPSKIQSIDEINKTITFVGGATSYLKAISKLEASSYDYIRSYTGPRDIASITGRSNIFDGGFGTFIVDPSDTTSADNDGTIIVDVTGRRWKREIIDDAYLFTWFKDNDGTDITPALQSALDLNPKKLSLGGLADEWLMTDRVVINDTIELYGGSINYTPSAATLALTNYGQASAFYASNDQAEIYVRDLTVSGNMTIDINAGFINGFAIHKAKRLVFKRTNLYGFNFSGVYAGRSSDINNSQDGFIGYLEVSDGCDMSNNRYAGVLSGEGDRAVIYGGNTFDLNGFAADLFTGYGVAFYSNAEFQEIIVDGNFARYNSRKGFDLHSGRKSVITSNQAIGNKLFGIYNNSVIKGNVTTIVSDNIVDMRGYPGDVSNITPGFEVFGILSRQTFQATSPEVGEEIKSIITDNQITMPAYADANIIAISVRNNAYVKRVNAVIADNIIKSDRLYHAVECQNVPKAGFEAAFEYFRASVENNDITCATSNNPPIRFIGSLGFDRIKVRGNTLDVGATTFVEDSYIYLNSIGDLGYFETSGNDVKSGNPNKSVSIIDTYTVSVSKAQMQSFDNTLNNTRERNWNGFYYEWWQDGITAPTSGSWTKGSRIYNFNTAISGYDKIVCVGGNDSGGMWGKSGLIEAI